MLPKVALYHFFQLNLDQKGLKKERKTESMAYSITVKTTLKGHRKIKLERLMQSEEKSIAEMLREAIDLLIKEREKTIK
jgi:hypothetical protein